MRACVRESDAVEIYQQTAAETIITAVQNVGLTFDCVALGFYSLHARGGGGGGVGGQNRDKDGEHYLLLLMPVYLPAVSPSFALCRPSRPAADRPSALPHRALFCRMP